MSCVANVVILSLKIIFAGLKRVFLLETFELLTIIRRLAGGDDDC